MYGNHEELQLFLIADAREHRIKMDGKSTFTLLVNEPHRIKNIPNLIRNWAARPHIRVNRPYYNWRYFSLGTDFMSAEWDNLILLDAARPDLLHSVDAFADRNIDERYSPGSSSPDFMQSQFAGRQLHDTVYVTGNPHIEELPNNIFHDVINLYRNSWSEKSQTVLPESAVEAALSAYDKYPDKRLIVHFMQPHFPFLGEAGEEIGAGIAPEGANPNDYTDPWREQMWGNRNDRQQLLQAYRENHEIAATYASKLVDHLSGRSVITADHANLIGERGVIPFRLYGHPRNFAHPTLLRVPWIEIKGEPRDVVAEPPTDTEPVHESNVEDKLKALGYA